MPKSHYFRRILGFVILFAAIATFTAIIRYFIESAKNDKKNLSRTISTDISMKKIHFTESRQNHKLWELFALSGIYDKPKEITTMENIRFIVERDAENGPVTVTAKHGEYLHTEKIVHLEGDVLARTKNGMTFETSKINYDSLKHSFTTKEKVTLTDEALTVEGVGMDLFIDRQEAIIKNNVEATVYPGQRIK